MAEETTKLQTEKYEISFIVGEAEKSDGVEKAIIDSGAKITKNTDLGIKQFAYLIKKKDVGRYFVLQFEATPENLKKMAGELKQESSVVRYLIIKALRFPEKRPLREKEPAKTEDKDKTVKPEVQTKTEVKVETETEKVEIQKAPEVAVKEETKKSAERVEPTEKAPVKKAPARKKPVKISAKELDKKLEELVED